MDTQTPDPRYLITPFRADDVIDDDERDAEEGLMADDEETDDD
jgi:hypothetical protein